MKAIRPIGGRVDSQRIGSIEKSEHIRCARTRALEGEAAVKFIFGIQSFVKTCLQRVLMSVADRRNLAVEVWQWIEFQQRLRLWADPILRNCVVRKWSAGCWIDDRVGKDSAALCRVGHQSCCYGIGSISRPLVVEKEVRSLPEQMRDLQWTTQRQHSCDSVVCGLRRALTCERKRASIEGGVVEDYPDSTVI